MKVANVIAQSDGDLDYLSVLCANQLEMTFPTTPPHAYVVLRHCFLCLCTTMQNLQPIIRRSIPQHESLVCLPTNLCFCQNGRWAFVAHPEGSGDPSATPRAPAHHAQLLQHSASCASAYLGLEPIRMVAHMYFSVNTTIDMYETHFSAL